MAYSVVISNKPIRYSWWKVALMALAVSALSRLTASKSSLKQQKFYSKKLKQAPWAPPGWVFGPAWTINNFFLILGLLKILNEKNSPEKTKLLAMQALIWFIFFSFEYVYFTKRSPILAAIWTKTDSALAIASFFLARKINKDIARSYLPLMVWTGFASKVADYQALHNPDPVFSTKPLLELL